MAHRGWSISLEGTAEAVKNFQQVKRLANGAEAQHAILPGAKLIRDIAKRLVHRTSGERPHGAQSSFYAHLQDAIFADIGQEIKGALGDFAYSAGLIGPSVIAGVDIKKSPHAHLVEWGHRIVTHAGVDTGKTVDPHPFMRPAVDAARPLLKSILEQGLIALFRPFSK